MVDPLWNEANLTEEQKNKLNKALILIVAWEPNGSMKPIGTGFIVSFENNTAVVFTAAHNLHEGAIEAQQPKRYRASSFLREFLKPISLDRKTIRAISFSDGKIELCVIKYAVWDKRSDFAVLIITTQGDSQFVFSNKLGITNQNIFIGEEFALLGFSNLEISYESIKGQSRFAKMRFRTLLRRGKVLEYSTSGFGMTTAAAFKTSIPIFPGMSGGPVFKLPNAGETIQASGIISHSPEDEQTYKNNFSKSGNSIIAALPISKYIPTGSDTTVFFDLLDTEFILNENEY